MLLDTNALLWLEGAPSRLSMAARDAITRTAEIGERLTISALSLWETALLKKKGRIALGISIGEFLDQIEQTYRVLPITGKIAALAAEFPDPFPKDPMDRLIVATAMVNEQVLITADQAIRASAVCSICW